MMPTRSNITGSLALALLLLPLVGCQQETLSLPIAHAAASANQIESELDVRMQRATEVLRAPSQSCYNFMLLRPKEQRAAAVQARLKQADQMAAALDSRTFEVDLVGDHANILSLQFPVIWPVPPSYSDRVSSVIEDYFSAPEVQDNLCNSGFEEVQLSARGRNDRRRHPVWTARVTTEGLVRETGVTE